MLLLGGNLNDRVRRHYKAGICILETKTAAEN